MMMHKDEAMDIAHGAKTMSLPALLAAYGRFHEIVCNTATMPADTADGKLHSVDADLMHAAFGLVTESAEILDALKKQFYGKRKPYSPDNIKEELGDLWFYFHLALVSQGLRLHDILADNVAKLANRYIEKFPTTGPAPTTTDLPPLVGTLNLSIGQTTTPMGD